jgi:hypothetical protein
MSMDGCDLDHDETIRAEQYRQEKAREEAMTGADEMRERAKAKGVALLEDAAYFRGLGFHALDKKLTGCDAVYLRSLAMALNVAHRYDDGSLKPKDVMVAALYEELRRKAVA